MLAVQYLEDGPHLESMAPEAARRRLRSAFDCLPITSVILGWTLPRALKQACLEEVARAGAQAFRWHPLLAGAADFVPRPEWRVMGLNHEPIPGFQGLPEFTFMCPNRPAAREAALGHLQRAIRAGDDQGVFLDRIRYPSPAVDPARGLSCFCEDCYRAAAAEGLDLGEVRRQIEGLLTMPDRARPFVRVLLDSLFPASSDPALAALRAFLDFRARSVTRFVRAAAEAIRAQGLAVGLDCFSPGLTYLVGQDLTALDAGSDWIKVMTYGHTLGPAGLPFELLQLANWLMAWGGLGEAEALECVSLSAQVSLPIPSGRAGLAESGLKPEALAGEIRRGRAAGVRTLLAGIELVRCEGITRLDEAQIVADLGAIRAARADGLVLSWDLWHIPPEWLELVRQGWGA